MSRPAARRSHRRFRALILRDLHPMNESGPRARLTREERRTTLQSFNWSAGLRTFYDTACGGSTFIFVAFALSLGLEKERIGLVTTVVSSACILQMFGLALVNFVRDRKAFILSVALVEPLLMIAAVLAVPFLPKGIQLWTLGAAVFLAAASLHLTRPLADNWVASTIPAGIRGRFLGRRFQTIYAFMIASMLLAGYVAERIDKSDSFGLGCALAGGGLFGILSVLPLRNATMPAESAFQRITWKHALEAFRVRPYRNYLFGILIFNVPFFLSVPYYQVFNLSILHMKESLIAYMTIGYLVVRVLAAPYCARFIERKGIRRATFATGPLYVLFFLAFIFCTPDRVWPLFVAWALAGAADATYAISATVVLYDSVPETPGRPIYFAIANLVGIGMFGVGGAVALPILQAMKGVSLHVGPLAIGQFHCFYAMCAILMVPALLGVVFFADRPKR